MVKKTASSSSPEAVKPSVVKKTQQQPKAAPVKTAKKQRVSNTLSPRAASAPLLHTTTTNASTAVSIKPPSVTYKEVRGMADTMSRSISRFSQISAGVARSKSGSYNIGGKTYTSSDVREMSQSLSRGVRRLPTVCKLSSKRNANVLTDEERESRANALFTRATAGVEELTSTLSIPSVGKVLLRNEKIKIFSNKSPSKPESGNQISAAFYISDQFREFVRNGNFGNGIAMFFPGMSHETKCISGATDPDAAIEAVSRELGKDVVAELGVSRDKARILSDPRRVMAHLVIEKGIITAPLLMSLMAKYISVNELKDPETGRINVDENIKRHLGAGNTRHILNGVDVTPQDADAALLAKSGLERLLQRLPKNVGDPLPYDGNTFTRAMSITLASMYRIPKAPTEASAVLTKPRTVNMATGLNVYL